MNFYPEQLQSIVIFIEALNEADKRVTAMDASYGMPYIKGKIALTDEGDSDLGYLGDEIGGAWSWTPPGGTA